MCPVVEDVRTIPRRHKTFTKKLLKDIVALEKHPDTPILLARIKRWRSMFEGEDEIRHVA